LRGYFKNPEATGACTTVDGFVTCGFLVVVDDEGVIRVVGRKSDVIVSGGVNVHPREVEDVIAAHPSVLETAVTGVPSEQWGEEVAAFVVLSPGAERLDVKALEAHCRTSLAGYKIPRHWTVIAQLPRNAAGKVVKRELAA
jgi:long-chain acyl-CoA synthetase